MKNEERGGREAWGVGRGAWGVGREARGAGRGARGARREAKSGKRGKRGQAVCREILAPAIREGVAHLRGGCSAPGQEAGGEAGWKNRSNGSCRGRPIRFILSGLPMTSAFEE